MVRSAVLVLHIGLDGGDRPLELSIAVSLLLLDDCFGDLLEMISYQLCECIVPYHVLL